MISVGIEKGSLVGAGEDCLSSQNRPCVLHGCLRQIEREMGKKERKGREEEEEKKKRKRNSNNH